MSNYPGPPGEVPPTQIAPSGPPPQQPGPPPGYPPQQPPPYGAPGGGGGGFAPPPYPAPPGGGGGGKKVAIIVALIVGGLVLLVIGGSVLVYLLAGDDDEDAKRPKVTRTVTAEVSTPTTDLTVPTTDITTPTTSDTAVVPATDPQITARAYLDSLVTGACLAVQGLSTPEWFASEYGTRRGCQQASPNAEMSGALYDWGENVDNGDGTLTVTADVTAPDSTVYDTTWTLVPSDDGTTWLVDFFLLAEA